MINVPILSFDHASPDRRIALRTKLGPDPSEYFFGKKRRVCTSAFIKSKNKFYLKNTILPLALAFSIYNKQPFFLFSTQ